MKHRSRPFKAFIHQKRRLRRQKFVALRWLIKQDPNGRGVFMSDHMLPGGTYRGEAVLANEKSSWADFYFLGEAQASLGFFFNATVRSVVMSAVDWAEDYAYDRIKETLSEEEYALAYPPLQWIESETKRWRVFKPSRDHIFERLGGVTIAGLRAVFLREAKEHLPPQPIGCVLDREYAYGIGALFVAAEEIVGLDCLDRLVADFRRHGETDYVQEEIARTDPVWGPRFREAIEDLACTWDRIDARDRGMPSEASPGLLESGVDFSQAVKPR